MLDIETIHEMSEDDIGVFVRELETKEDLQAAVAFAQDLRAYGLNELSHRELPDGE